MSAYYNEFEPFAAAWLRELIADGLIAEYDAREPRPALTYEDVEAIWEDEIQPMLPDFASMQVTDDGPPADSRWRANWAIPARG